MRNRFKREHDGYLEWVRLTDTPLLVVAVIFLALLILPYAVHLSHAGRVAVGVANICIWLAFGIDYFVRLYLAIDRRQYVRRNVLDLLIVVVPFLRPIRAVRLLRLLRVATVAGVVNKRAASLHARVTTYVATTALAAVLLASYFMYDAERAAPGANIKSVGDSLWWSISTITTVGYGDRFPVTGEGKVIAVMLMVVGIALLGVITANVAAWFIGHMNRVEAVEEESAATLDEVLAELRRLNARLDAVDAATRSG